MKANITHLDYNKSSPLRNTSGGRGNVNHSQIVYPQESTINISNQQVTLSEQKHLVDVSSFSNVNAVSSYYDRGSVHYKARQETVQTFVD